MSKKQKVIRRGKIIYIVNSDSIVVGVGGNQWISYNQYNNHNRQGITAFRAAILKSKEDEYANAVDQMSLAVQCGIKGTGTQVPKGFE